MPDLVRLVYVSRPTRLLPGAEMARLLDSARAHNAACAVTGSLLVLSEAVGGPGAYVQWIEGPGAGVAAVYQRIVDDDRHDSLRILDRSAVDGRAYPSWTMRHEVIPAGTVETALARFGIESTA